MRRQVEEMMISSISEYQLIILGVPRILTLSLTLTLIWIHSLAEFC